MNVFRTTDAAKATMVHCACVRSMSILTVMQHLRGLKYSRMAPGPRKPWKFSPRLIWAHTVAAFSRSWTYHMNDTHLWGAAGHLSCSCRGPQLMAPHAKQCWIHCTGGPCWGLKEVICSYWCSFRVKEVSSSALQPILKHVLDNCLAAKPDDDHLVINNGSQS